MTGAAFDESGDRVEAMRLYELSRACADCCSEAQFIEIVRTWVRPLLPHGLLAAAVGRVDLNHLEVLRLIGVDYPQGALELLPKVLNLRERPVVQAWLAAREPLIVSLPRDANRLSSRERLEIESFGLGRLAIHGAVDVSSRAGVYLSFGQVDEALTDEALKGQLRLIAPPLSQALMTVHSRARASSPDPLNSLSPAERELLFWLVVGRSNAEIAQLRGRSVATVRNQLHSVFNKLGVSSRIEAVRLHYG